MYFYILINILSMNYYHFFFLFLNLIYGITWWLGDTDNHFPLQREVCDIVQEAVIKTIPKKKKCKKAKWLSEEALQTPMKRREAKGKGEKKRYTHLNAEFQRLARRDKKAFLGYQCKEIKENNRMGKTRDFFKKIRDTKGTFHANKGHKWYGPNRSRRY